MNSKKEEEEQNNIHYSLSNLLKHKKYAALTIDEDGEQFIKNVLCELKKGVDHIPCKNSYERLLCYFIGEGLHLKTKKWCDETDEIIIGCKDFSKYGSLGNICRAYRQDIDSVGKDWKEYACGCDYIPEKITRNHKNNIGLNYDDTCWFYRIYNTQKLGVVFGEKIRKCKKNQK